jgi:hypothetical protein
MVVGMTTLRACLIRELTLRGSSPRTIESYVSYVAAMAQHYGRSPDRLSDEQIKAYLFGLHTERKLSASTINVAVNALRFFYLHVLESITGVSTLTGVNSALCHRGQLSTLDGRVSHRGQLSTLDGRVLWAVD